MIPSDYVTRTSSNGNDPFNLRNIITDYGTIKLEVLTMHRHTYVSQNTRRSQDKRALSELLMHSISPDANNKIMVWST